MMRVALAILVAAVLVTVSAILIRSAARAVERVGTSSDIASGGTMQKAAFFLLLCLIMYVSVTGGA